MSSMRPDRAVQDASLGRKAARAVALLAGPRSKAGSYRRTTLENSIALISAAVRSSYYEERGCLVTIYNKMDVFMTSALYPDDEI